MKQLGKSIISGKMGKSVLGRRTKKQRLPPRYTTPKTWIVTFEDGTKLRVSGLGLYTGRHAIALALKEHKGTVKSVKYIKS